MRAHMFVACIDMIATNCGIFTVHAKNIPGMGIRKNIHSQISKT